MRVEGTLEASQAGVELTEEGRRVLRAHALTVLSPQQAVVALGQRRHLIGDFADHRLLARVLHVHRRAHMQHSGVDVAEHAVLEPSGIEQGAELGDVVGQVLGGYRGILDEGQRALLALDVAEQAHRALAHGVDPTDGVTADGLGEAQASDAGVAFESPAKGVDSGLEALGVVVIELHQVDAFDGRAVIHRKELGHRVPHEVLHGQPQHLVVHGLDGGGANRLWLIW